MEVNFGKVGDISVYIYIYICICLRVWLVGGFPTMW